jgi:hypothetical protein
MDSFALEINIIGQESIPALKIPPRINGFRFVSAS